MGENSKIEWCDHTFNPVRKCRMDVSSATRKPNRISDSAGRNGDQRRAAYARGESGTRARPMHPDWVRSIRNECVDAGIPFLFKQWGAWLPYDVRYSDKYPQNMGSSDHTVLEDSLFAKVGKYASGRLLDGQEWNQFPQQARS